MRLLFGVVNHTLPAPSIATKIGWFPVMFGSVKNCGVCDPAGIFPICPGAALLEHVGAKSHPGSANHRFPDASIADPHGSPTPPESAYVETWPLGVGVAVGVA